jgi:hypothetical protein
MTDRFDRSSAELDCADEYHGGALAPRSPAATVTPEEHEAAVRRAMLDTAREEWWHTDDADAVSGYALNIYGTALDRAACERIAAAIAARAAA